jgi:DNA replication and repair protein RecF
MIFTDIRLQQYRSYTDASFDLGPGVNIVVGPNAAGKTNLLEALMVSAIGRSYRAKDFALIQFDKPWTRIDVHTSDNQTRVVKLRKQDNDKSIREFEFDNKPYKRFPASQKQPVVLFEPNDLNLLHGDPNARRDYMDDRLEQYITGYDKLRASYKRVVSQRNALLKQENAGSSQLFAWNLRLCDLASQIVAKRLEFVDSISSSLAATYSSIADQKTSIKIGYETKQNLNDYSSSLLKRLEAEQELDYARGFTGSGPHRDDLVIYFDDTPAVRRASRGEIRTLLLSLKIIELKLFEEKLDCRPLLLLDDVFSELDGARRRALTEFLKNYQTLITTTDADVVIQHFTEKCTIIPVDKQ